MFQIYIKPVPNKSDRNARMVTFVYFLKWGIPGLFLVYFGKFSNSDYNFYSKIMRKMNIQYTVLGFEPTAFRL